MLGTALERVDALLARTVRDGRVDYASVCEDPDLQAGLDAMASQDGSALRTREERVAFLLNAYNLAAVALACRLQRRAPRVEDRGFAGWGARLRFFFLERIPVAGRSRTLFGLEFFVLRGVSRDPRLHFALVCATASCPPLKGGLYRAERLDEDLDRAARAFLQPGVGYTLDRDRNVLRLNRIFRWYRRDFRRHGGPVRFLAAFGPPEDAAYVEERNPRIRYEAYDWRLNRAAP